MILDASECKIFEFFKNPTKTYAIDRLDEEKFQVKRGLRNGDGTGVVAGLTKICNVHGYVLSEGEKQPIEGELIYRGYNVRDMVDAVEKEKRFGFEETAYLLLTGELPDKNELKKFCDVLSNHRDLPNFFFEDVILKAPSPHVMNKLASTVLSLYTYDDDPENTDINKELQIAISLLARLPLLIVYCYQSLNRHFKNESIIMHMAQPGESTAETILSALRPDRKYTPEEAHLLDLCLMLHAEHGGGNNSTFACRVLTSSGTDPYSTYSAAIGSLKGPKHGGANKKIMQMLEDIEANVQHWDDEGEVADYLRKILRKEAGDGSGLIYGMGHAVYTLSDPRAVLLKRYAFDVAKGTDYEKEFNLLQMIETLSPELFAESRGEIKTICANVDMYSGLVYKMLGIPQELNTALFAVSRMAGWCAHRLEELLTCNRIIRPAYKAVQKPRNYRVLDKRD